MLNMLRVVEISYDPLELFGLVCQIYRNSVHDYISPVYVIVDDSLPRDATPRCIKSVPVQVCVNQSCFNSIFEGISSF